MYTCNEIYCYANHVIPTPVIPTPAMPKGVDLPAGPIYAYLDGIPRAEPAFYYMVVRNKVVLF